MLCAPNQSVKRAAIIVAGVIVTAQPTFSMATSENDPKAVCVVAQFSSDNAPQHSSYASSQNILEIIPDELRFGYFAKQWKSNRKGVSSFSREIAGDPNYLSIVGMGQNAVPFILAQLRDELKAGHPDHWFIALWAITKENPVAEKDQGRIRQMAEAWLTWGESQGLIA